MKCYFFQDQMLTKEEILENWNMFVGSQATNYGEDLTRNHDELWTWAKSVELYLINSMASIPSEAMPQTDLLQRYLTEHWT